MCSRILNVILHKMTYASGGPLEQDGLSPTVRLYSRISIVSQLTCFSSVVFFRLDGFKLSFCVKTFIQLLFGFVFAVVVLILLFSCMVSLNRTLNLCVVSMVAGSEHTEVNEMVLHKFPCSFSNMLYLVQIWAIFGCSAVNIVTRW